MANYWTEISGKVLATLEETVTTAVNIPLSQNDAVVTVISGSLPKGMQLKNNQIVGTPAEVPRVTTYQFVLRATYNNQISDRTFKIIVNGPDEPVWETAEGKLPIGANNTFYILDSSPVDFQLVANDPDTAAGQTLEYYIGSGDGTLPPGIQLTADGKIVGIVDPILAIEKSIGNGSYDTGAYDARSNPYDFGIKSSNGFDSFFYDTTIYDLSIPTKSPKKLNRYYEFTVSVSDGDTIARRTFTIFVVGDDFLRTDNTVMQVGTGVFTADNTHIRTPIWLTPRDFGIRRANNYVTLFLDVIDPNTLTGVVTYTLERFNDDGTESKLPEGMALDNTTGEVAGRVPYQPSINKEYKFSVKASRYGPTSSAEFIAIRTLEDVQAGSNQIKIYKNPEAEDLIGLQINIGSNSFIIDSVDTRDNDFDILILSQPISIQIYETAEIGANKIAIRKVGKPFLEDLIDSGINLYGQNVTITSVDYNLKAYRAREDHTSNTFSSDLYNDKWEEVTNYGNTDNLNYWSSSIGYQKGDIVKFNNTQFEYINIDQNLTVRVFAGISLEVKIPTTVSDIIPANTTYDIQVVNNVDLEVAESTKTFTVTMLGEVNSEINFTTGSDLGRIGSNYTSTLQVIATSTVRNAKVLYSLVGGTLPPGLSLGFDGNISGSVNQFGDATTLGMTTFDTNTFTLDGNSTRIDRRFAFTIKAQDQFLYSAVEKEFIITVDDPDNRAYSNLSFKPFLKSSTRTAFNTFISNPEVFNPNVIYRPYDRNFGIARELKMLMYAGIETKAIEQYMAAIAQNHKRKTFKLGDVKTAVAKTPGTNDIVYEVVYVDIIDPYAPKKGKTAKSIRIDTNNIITVDETQKTTSRTSIVAIDVIGRGDILNPEFSSGGLKVRLRGENIRVGSENSFTITFQNDTIATYNGRLVEVNQEGYAPYTLPHDPTNLIKADMDAVKVSESKDQIKYISNVANMRDNISRIGITERDFLPLWMRTTQEGSVQELGWIPAVPLCYTIPGESSNIANAIKNTGFDFKQFDFDIDRYIIDNTIGNSNEQYLLFGNYQYNI